MSKQWFGDSRDYVKWDFLVRECGGKKHLCYIAMLRPDTVRLHLHGKVLSFFDRYKNLDLVSDLFEQGYSSILDVYEHRSADEYFDQAETLIVKAQESGSVVIFADPDTGLEPEKSLQVTHLRICDLQRLADLLRQQDVLVVYQHAPLTCPEGWIQARVNRVRKLAWTSRFDISVYHDEKCARDVCFIRLRASTP